ncbi:Putative membrane-bound ClpP-class protease associated with aq_911, partial [hydrothermal vent metagenome]
VFSAGKSAMVITIDGSINPVTAEFITESIKTADKDPDIEVLVIEMDTPGGLDTSMRQIIKGMQAAKKPVVVYVAPSGSRAASAGAFITVAAHVAAMAPGTNIGSASPVNMGGGGMDKTMKKKVTNDAAAYIKSLAEAHGRNGKLAEKFVRKSSNMPETEAKKENIIDFIADDLPSLLKAIDGTKVKTSAGERTLKTAGLTIKKQGMNWRQEVFNALANPNIAYILMMLGFYGLFFELSNPGSIVPGVIGAISLILAFYSMQTLPINYAGALLIALAVILFLLEIKVPSYGILTIGGIISFTIGSMMLVDSPEEYLNISFSVIAPTAILTAAFFLFLVGSAIKIQSKKTKTGKEGMIGAEGVVDSVISGGKAGTIFVVGELWNAVTDADDIKKGESVEVTGQNGLTLIVKPRGKGAS